MTKIKYYFEEFNYTLRENGKFKFFLSLFLVLTVGLSFLSVKNYFSASSFEKTRSLKLEQGLKDNKQFSLLAERVKSNTNGTVNVVYDVYNMKPYVKSDFLNSQISNLVNSVKEKYNTGSRTNVSSVAIRVYNRKIIFNYGLTPDLLYTYALDSNLEGISKSDHSEKDVYTKTWEYTNNQKKIDYSKYVLTRQGNVNDAEKPEKSLSDQEYAFWLKLKLYQSVLKSTSVSNSVKAYLNFDLGVTSDYNSISQTLNRFTEFDQRDTIPSYDYYYPNQIKLRDAMACYRPQLLYFLSTGEVENSYTESQKKLIKLNSEKYEKVISEHLDKAAKEHKNDVLFDDPFSTMKDSKNLKENFHTEFYPTLKQNNKHFSLTPQINEVQKGE